MCPKSNKKKITDIAIAPLLGNIVPALMLPMVLGAIGRARRENDVIETRTRIERRAFSKVKERRRFASFSYSETRLIR